MGPHRASISGKDAARYVFYKVIYTFEMSLLLPRVDILSLPLHSLTLDFESLDFESSFTLIPF